MSSHGPWSVKGIDGRAREVAKQEARLKGVTLGRYINELLLRGHSEAGPRELDTAPIDGDLTAFEGVIRKLETATADALRGVDGSLEAINQRLDTAETNHEALGRDTEALLRELTQTQAALQEKIQRLEQRGEGVDTVEALRTLETALGKLASHVYEENSLVQDETMAIKGRVEAGFSELEGRLDKVELTLIQTAETDTTALSERLETLNGALVDLRSHIDEIQRQSEVELRTLDQRLQTFYADFDAKFVTAERRSHGAIRQFSDQATTRIQRIQARHEQDVGSLRQQLKASERRQADHLSLAMDNVSDRLSGLQEQTASVMSPVQKAIAMIAARLELLEDGEDGHLSPSLSEALPPIPAFRPKVEALDLSFFDEETPTPTSEASGLQRVEPSEVTAGSPARSSGTVGSDSNAGPLRGAGFGRLPRRSQRDPGDPLPLAVAQSSVEESFGVDDDRHETRDSDIFDDGTIGLESGAGSQQSQEETATAYLDLARSAALRGHTDYAERSPPFRLRFSVLIGIMRHRKIATVVSGFAVILLLTGVVLALHKPPAATMLTAISPAPITDAETLSVPSLSAEPGPVPAGPTADVLEDAGMIDPVDPAAIVPHTEVMIPEALTLETVANEGDPIAQFQLGEKQISLGEVEAGVTYIEAAAATGLVAAEYRLAKLYEEGLGLPVNLTEARFWTERAAMGGNSMAMHDMAVFFAEGEGGPQSYAAAARWFRQAGELGVVDSQFNLAVLYENGLGVPPDIMEALFWFSVAAASGDLSAEQEVARLSNLIGPELSTTIADRVFLWEVEPSDAEAHGYFGPQLWEDSQRQQLEAIQRALTSLGYAAGADDGIMGPSTRGAIMSFQSEMNLTPNGEVTPELISALNGDPRTRL